MTDVFISYKKEERSHAKALAQALEQRALKTWWDVNLETSAEPFYKQIWRELERSKAIIVLWSPASLNSPWVTSEAQYAIETGKLICVKIAEVQLLPPFNGPQFADLRDWTGQLNHSDFIRITSQIERLMKPVPTKPDIVLPPPLPVVAPRAAHPNGTRRFLVNPAGGPGVLRTIQEAIETAVDGDTIEVDAGTYRECITLRKAVRIIGRQSGAERPKLIGPGQGRDTLVINGNAVVDGLVVTQPDCSGVIWVQGGAPTLSGLLISNAGEVVDDRNCAAMYIGGNATPTVSGLTISAASAQGLYFANTAAGSWRKISIRRTGGAAVVVNNNAAPTMQDVLIHNSQSVGLSFWNDSGGRYHGVNVVGGQRPAFVLNHNANPILTNCACSDASGNGLQVNDDAQGEVADMSFVRVGGKSAAQDVPIIWLDERARTVIRNPHFQDPTGDCVWRVAGAPNARITGGRLNGHPITF